MLSKVLSIAGFDGSGGAGIQADLKTFSAFGCYGMTVLTALPIQNTLGVQKCYEIPLIAIREQLEAIFSDITPQTIKIGMLFNSQIVELVADFLAIHARDIPIVLDPVMLAKSGDPLLLPEAIKNLKEKLVPLCTVITPNLPEAEVLSDLSIKNREDMQRAADKILALGCEAVLVKGGHLEDNISYDLLVDREKNSEWFSCPKINTRNTHGTGCTLSAAIASCLSLGFSLTESCLTAKRYLTAALEAARDEKIGKGNGPVNHLVSCGVTTVLQF